MWAASADDVLNRLVTRLAAGSGGERHVVVPPQPSYSDLLISQVQQLRAPRTWRDSPTAGALRRPQRDPVR